MCTGSASSYSHYIRCYAMHACMWYAAGPSKGLMHACMHVVRYLASGKASQGMACAGAGGDGKPRAPGGRS